MYSICTSRDHGRAKRDVRQYLCKTMRNRERELTKLLLAVEPEVTDDDYDLADERDPERRGRERAAF